MTVDLHCGDCLDVLGGMEANAFDGVLCDPPYALRFMSAHWDYDIPSAEVWAEVLRVCKPGAMLMAFGGTRTFHRLTCAIEDAGWIIRDCVVWLYGSGFPKSANIGKQIDKAAGATRDRLGTKVELGVHHGKGNWIEHEGYARPWKSNPDADAHYVTAPATPLAATWDGYGTALKPAWEPCIVAMKPTDGTFAQNAAKWGVAGLAIDACRIPTDEALTHGGPLRTNSGDTRNGKALGMFQDGTPNTYVQSPSGRWPANLILDSEAAALLDQQSGVSTSTAAVGVQRHGRSGGIMGAVGGLRDGRPEGHNDTGGASRYFKVVKGYAEPMRFLYTAKASRREREAGLEGLPERVAGAMVGNQTEVPSRTAGDGVTPVQQVRARNFHPTVKPLALTEYLARLILPPAAYRDTARLLVPFSGSGSEMIGALRAGWRNVEGIEREAEYVEIARRRLEWWQRQLRDNARALPEWVERDELEVISD